MFIVQTASCNAFLLVHFTWPAWLVALHLAVHMCLLEWPFLEALFENGSKKKEKE